MYRVVTTYRNGSARPIVEAGPWHPSRKDAELWAELLQASGYHVSIESQHAKQLDGDDDHDSNDLAAALANMA